MSVFNSLMYYILTVAFLPSTLPSSAPLSPRSSPPLFHFREEQAPQGYKPNTAEQVTVSLGTNPYIRAGQGSPVGGKAYISLKTQKNVCIIGSLSITFNEQAGPIVRVVP